MPKQRDANSFEILPDSIRDAELHGDHDYLTRLISEEVAAEFLGIEVKTLQGWRVKGGGPSFIRLSRRAVRYQRRALLEWVYARVHTSTSEYAQ